MEARVPFLNITTVQLADALPPGLKQRGRTGKWVFKKAMEPYLPHEVIYRPNWSIWSIPSFWSFGLRDERDEREKRDERVYCVQRSLRAAYSVDASYALLSLLCIDIWCRTFLDGSRSKSPPTPLSQRGG